MANAATLATALAALAMASTAALWLALLAIKLSTSRAIATMASQLDQSAALVASLTLVSPYGWQSATPGGSRPARGNVGTAAGSASPSDVDANGETTLSESPTAAGPMQPRSPYTARDSNHPHTSPRPSTPETPTQDPDTRTKSQTPHPKAADQHYLRRAPFSADEDPPPWTKSHGPVQFPFATNPWAQFKDFQVPSKGGRHSPEAVAARVQRELTTAPDPESPAEP